MDLSKYTHHKNTVITSRGNEGIKIALEAVKTLSERKVILIPDQGGWLSYRKIPKELGFEIVEIPTDRGLINPEHLKKYLQKAAAILFTSFAGYYAEQPLEEISKVCRKEGVLLIEDVSGSFGDDVLCNGELSDFIIGSFSDWKIVNYGTYGFVSSNLELNAKSIEYKKDLEDKIAKAPQRLKNLLALAEKVKTELESEIFHKDKRGVNVITEYSEEVINYCKTKDYKYVICPKYYKVMEKAISIELKRLNI
jgi:cysteine sulfinate desulfinase/cysteine desulfurase-like protein